MNTVFKSKMNTPGNKNEDTRFRRKKSRYSACLIQSFIWLTGLPNSGNPLAFIEDTRKNGVFKIRSNDQKR